jgi:uncharacterized protein (TIGR04141 family)
VVSIACYRLRSTLQRQPVEHPDAYLDVADPPLQHFGPVEGDGFIATLHVSRSVRRAPPWWPFVRDGFAIEDRPPLQRSISAVIILKLVPEGDYFAFPFGPGGRFLLKAHCWVRGYGLRSALNLIYPAGTSEAVLDRLIAVDAKRRGGETLRSRRQSSRATTLETFDVDKFRDVVSATTGRPIDGAQWGSRVTGSDPLHFGTKAAFAELGNLCRAVDAVHAREDYQERFGWIDFIKPVDDHARVLALEDHVVRLLKEGDLDGLDLAPPEIVDWTKVTDFQFYWDYRSRPQVVRREMSLSGLVNRIRYDGDLDVLDADRLRTRPIRAVDADLNLVHRWTVWECLAGEVALDGEVYVLDEGDFFQVSQDFLGELNAYIDAIGTSGLALPKSSAGEREADYNIRAAADLPALLLDKQTVKVSAQTTAIEVCDLLTADRHLVHVKRHFGSSDLSHLFAQGAVSAQLLQQDLEFRGKTQATIHPLDPSGTYGFIDAGPLDPRTFQIVYAISGDWRGRTTRQALPFFSKVNLRTTHQELESRGFRVSCDPIPYA